MKKKILFVCVENSCRSQMAEAFAKLHGAHKVESYSAGSQPSGIVNAKAIESMNAIGYNLGKHCSKSTGELPEQMYDYVVTMGCGDACPYIPAKIREDWQIPDPKSLPRDEFDRVRDIIESEVIHLLDTIDSQGSDDSG